MRPRIRPLVVCLLVPFALAASMPQAHAIHWYRNTMAGCSSADGALSDDGSTGTAAAVVEMGHNTFRDTDTGFSFDGPAVTTITVGEAVTWTWNSAHCHSVETAAGGEFASGFHYPMTPPDFPPVAAVPGAFDYPVLDDTPTLTFTHTFDSAGSFSYFCIHHGSIGMIGTVVVNP